MLARLASGVGGTAAAPGDAACVAVVDELSRTDFLAAYHQQRPVLVRGGWAAASAEMAADWGDPE
eukprot:6733370-Prymnesium_polylepis.1